MSIIKFRFAETIIVIGARAQGPERTAAASIRERIAGQAGADLPIVTEGEHNLPGANLLVIGTPDTCDVLRQMKKPRHDGWLIEVQRGRVTLLGGSPRGALYAADAFLDSIEIGADSFAVEGCRVLEEPSFPKRLIFHHWDPEFATEQPALMSRHRLNGCVLVGVPSSEGVLLQETFPDVYGLVQNREKAERCRLRELHRAEKLTANRECYGISTYVYLAVGLPSHLRDAVYKAHPDVKGVSHPNSYESAHICPSNPTSWVIWRAIVEEIIAIYPGAEGLYLDIMHNGYGIYCQCDRCRAMGLDDFPAELGRAVSETWDALSKLGKKLLYHTWSASSKPRQGRSQGSDSGRPWHLPGDRPEWVFRRVIEWTPAEIELVKMDTWGDALPTAPLDPLIGKTGKHPQIVQFHIAGEYRGFNKVPGAMVQLLKDRMAICAQRGVSGVLTVAGGWVDPYHRFWEDIINRVNFLAFARLAWNVEQDPDEIWNSWAQKTFGSDAAPQVVAALKLSQSVTEKSLGIKGLNFTDHSGFPTSIPRTWEISWDWSNYWYPDSHERFAITPENIVEIIAEKEEALATVREMLRLIDQARSHLQEEQYRELHERTEWLLHYATIQRHLAESYYRMLYLEELVKKGKTDAAQIDQIDRACSAIAQAHAKLPTSARLASYYQELPEKGAFPWYPAYPWLPAHSAGHPVKFAQMIRERAASIVHTISVWGKPN